MLCIYKCIYVARLKLVNSCLTACECGLLPPCRHGTQLGTHTQSIQETSPGSQRCMATPMPVLLLMCGTRLITPLCCIQHTSLPVSLCALPCGAQVSSLPLSGETRVSSQATSLKPSNQHAVATSQHFTPNRRSAECCAWAEHVTELACSPTADMTRVPPHF